MFSLAEFHFFSPFKQVAYCLKNRLQKRNFFLEGIDKLRNKLYHNVVSCVIYERYYRRRLRSCQYPSCVMNEIFSMTTHIAERMTTMNFGEKIKNARTAKSMSQAQLAKETGISLRTIQNYELNARMPKKRDTYAKLAEALGINEEVLLDDSASFVIQAAEQYGGRGRQQAEEIIRNFRVAAAGGELDDEDLDFIKEAMMQTYWDAKKYNERFRNKRFAQQSEES